MNDTSSDWSEDRDAITRKDLPLGELGSQQATATQFTTPRLPATRTEQSPEKQTRSIDWYRANFPRKATRNPGITPPEDQFPRPLEMEALPQLGGQSAPPVSLPSTTATRTNNKCYYQNKTR